MNEEEKILIARIKDLYRLCERDASAKFSPFLNESEIALIKAEALNQNGFNTAFYGGFDDAQRCMFGIFPEWQEAKPEDFPVTALKIDKGYKKELSHRDYLGTFLSLGIDRSKFGDILVSENGAYAFVSEDIADYLIFNIKKISNCGVKLKRVDLKNEELPKQSYEEINAVAASPRIDAVLSAALKFSRKESAMCINSGKVNVNHRLVQDISYSLKEGDLLSVRGFGRIIIENFGENTRSGRIHVVLKKYVR